MIDFLTKINTNTINFTTGSAKCITWSSIASGAGSPICIIGQTGAASNNGGGITITGGLGGATSSNGGLVTINGGNGATVGGGVSIYGGCGATTCGSIDLYTYCSTTPVKSISALPASCVELYYAGSVKLCTVNGGICLGTNCGFAADFIATSDIRIKRDIKPIQNSLQIVNNLCGVSYKLCNDTNNENRIGLIAQEVERVLPEVVSRSKASESDIKEGIIDEKLGIKYDKIVSVLIEAIKELTKRINMLEEKINSN